MQLLRAFKRRNKKHSLDRIVPIKSLSPTSVIVLMGSESPSPEDSSCLELFCWPWVSRVSSLAPHLSQLSTPLSLLLLPFFRPQATLKIFSCSFSLSGYPSVQTAHESWNTRRAPKKMVTRHGEDHSGTGTPPMWKEWAWEGWDLQARSVGNWRLWCGTGVSRHSQI